MEISRQALQAEHCGDLRPMPDFVHQDMEDNLPGRCSEAAIHNGELLGAIPVLGWKGVDELPKVLAALPTELE